ncbi:hypothetical protein SCUP234_05310 [Seiridium cupressi]
MDHLQNTDAPSATAILKARERERCTPRFIAHKHVPLPDTGIREVAGAVTRRTDRLAVPEPPPSNRSSTGTSRRKDWPHRRRRHVNGFHDDSDSDSDGDDKRRDHIREASPAVVPKRPLAKSGNFDDTFATSLALEEEERVRQLRDLREIGEKWEGIKVERDLHEIDNELRRQRLVLFRKRSFKNPTINAKLLETDIRLREYLDEVLYGAIKDVVEESESGPEGRTELEQIVQRLEMGVLSRLSKFGEWKLSSLSLHERLSQSLRAAENSCWNFKLQPLALKFRLEMGYWPGKASADPRSSEDHDIETPSSLSTSSEPPNTNVVERDFLKDVREQSWRRDSSRAVEDYMERVHPKRETRGERTFIDVLEESFWHKIVDKMSEAALSAEPPYLPDGHWLQCFQTSRQEGHLTASYIDWVTAGVDSAKLDRLSLEWHRVKRQEALESMASVEIQVQQVFCPNLIRPGEVSLLLIKGNYPTGIRTVSEDELRSLGWFRDHANDGDNDNDDMFWRCELVNRDEWGSPTDILKVDMSGKVLGAFCLQEATWVLLELIVGGRGGFQARPRRLNIAEMSILRG